MYLYYSFNLFGRSNLWGRFTFVALCWRLQPTMKHLALLPEAPGSVACAPLLPEEPVKHLVLFIATCNSSRVWQVFKWYRLFIFLELSSCIGFVLIRKWSQVISPYFGVFTTIKVKHGLKFWSHPSNSCYNQSILTGGSLKGGAGVQWHSRVSWGCEYPWEWAVESVPVLVCLREFVLMQLVCNSL